MVLQVLDEGLWEQQLLNKKEKEINFYSFFIKVAIRYNQAASIVLSTVSSGQVKGDVKGPTQLFSNRWGRRQQRCDLPLDINERLKERGVIET